MVTWNWWWWAYLPRSNWNMGQVRLLHSRTDLWNQHWLSPQDNQPCRWSNRLNPIQCHFHRTNPEIKHPLEELRDEVNVNFVFHFDISLKTSYISIIAKNIFLCNTKSCNKLHKTNYPFRYRYVLWKFIPITPYISKLHLSRAIKKEQVACSFLFYSR